MSNHFFGHEHEFIPQVFREVALQLQRKKFINFFDAGSRSVIIGAKNFFCNFHLHSNGSALVAINIFHCITCR